MADDDKKGGAAETTTTAPNDFHKFASTAWSQADVAEKYANAENATRPFARIMVEKSGLPSSISSSQEGKEVYNVFDLATGTGAAIQELYDAVPREKWGQLKVLGGDLSAPMLAYLGKRGEKQGWMGLETRVVDGNNIKESGIGADNTYTHVFLAFAIFGMHTVLPTLHSLLKSGGFIGVTTWAGLPWYEVLARSIGQIKGAPVPGQKELEGKMFAGRAWGERTYLEGQLGEAGFERVDTVREKHLALCGTPMQFMDTMQMPLRMVANTFWDEDKREEWFEQLKEIMLGEMVKEAGGEDEQVKILFDGIVGWGWKSG